MMVLVGPKGVGKTTLGHYMAVHHGWRWQDSDHVMCQDLGVADIRDAYQTLGVHAFRQLESDVVRQCLAKDLDVLTLGGGALRHGLTRQMLSEHCCVALSMSAHQLWQRWQTMPPNAWSADSKTFEAYLFERQRDVLLLHTWHTLDATQPLAEQASCLNMLR